VDCEREPNVADKFKIEGYPTIKLVKDNQVIEYDAKPDKEHLVQFLNTVI
jgi:thioredoxin-like negative regulator of GroEL